MKSFLPGVSILLSSLAAAQTDLPEALEAWRVEHGASWRAEVDRHTGHMELLYGGGARAPFVADTNRPQDWFALGRHWVDRTVELHGVPSAELVDGRFVYLPLGMGHGTDKISVSFDQQVAGLPVEGARVNALFDTSGRLLSLHSTAAPVTAGLSNVPVVSGRLALRTAVAAFERDALVPATRVGPPLLRFAQVERNGRRDALLAYQVSVHNTAAPAGFLYTIDAATGLVLRRDDEVHHLDVTGTVVSNATPGLESDHPGNPPAQLPMPYIDVTSSAGTVQTDRDGNFTFAGVNTPLDITIDYGGTFNEIQDQGGSDYSITFPSVQPNQANTLVMNPAPSENVNAEANSYLHINTVRDYIRDTVPSDSTADFQALSRPNIDQSCNAFYDGASVNYYVEKSGCYNTAYTTVVAHEYGHWLNVRYGTGNGSDGMGEGNADMWAMYTYDDEIVARYWTTSGGFLRTGLNTRQYCGDGNGGCYGGVHANGEVWMGAGWKVRRNLKATLGTALGGATADQLFVGWMNAYNQAQIDSIIEIQWLTLDDDDADITNGTPNYGDIDAAFLEQGFPGLDIEFVTITGVTQLPDVNVDAGPYPVTADLVANFTLPLSNPELRYRVNGGSIAGVPMTLVSGDTYTADLPAVAGAGVVEYHVYAEDGGGNAETSGTLLFEVGYRHVLFAWDFEAAGDEGWTGGIASDTASTGVWERGDPIPTVAQPDDDHTPDPGVNCWFTGQHVVGEAPTFNDVDNGRTTLRSPKLDLSGVSGVRVTYWRWFSNDEGVSPGIDTLVVQLDDGTNGYAEVEVVGPTGREASGEWFEGGFIVDTTYATTDEMRFRFRASDVQGASLIEAAIDDVLVTYLDVVPPDCDSASISCDTHPDNSATISIDTCTCAAGSMTVGLDGAVAPDGSLAYLLIGQGSTVIVDPPGSTGELCLGGATIGRYSQPGDLRTIVGGSAPGVDLLNAASGGGGGGIPTLGGNLCTPTGQTWSFQWWHRDGMNPSRFSSALTVTFD